MFVFFFLLSHFMPFLSPHMTIKCCPKAGDESLQHLKYHRIDKSKSICSPSDTLKLGMCVERGVEECLFRGRGASSFVSSLLRTTRCWPVN